MVMIGSRDNNKKYSHFIKQDQLKNRIKKDKKFSLSDYNFSLPRFLI